MNRILKGVVVRRGTLVVALAGALISLALRGEVLAQDDFQRQMCRMVLDRYAQCDAQTRDQAAMNLAGMLRGNDPATQAGAQQLLQQLGSVAAQSGEARLMGVAADLQARTRRYLQPPAYVNPPPDTGAPFVTPRYAPPPTRSKPLPPIQPVPRIEPVPFAPPPPVHAPETCLSCRGTGRVHCPHCSGGYLRGTGNPYQNPPTPRAVCPICSGSTEKRCLDCRGTGISR